MGNRRNRDCGRVAAPKGCETPARIDWLNGRLDWGTTAVKRTWRLEIKWYLSGTWKLERPDEKNI